jgi:hypothetical protein
MLEGCGVDSSCKGQGSAAVSCEHGNKHSGSIEGAEFLDNLSVSSTSQGLCFMGSVKLEKNFT